MNRIENQTLALAGLFQSAALVEQLAFSGETDRTAFECCFDSLFTFDAASTVEVFGDLAGLDYGFKALANYLGGEYGPSGKNIAYYVMSMLKIASVLKSDTGLSSALKQSLRDIDARTREFEMSKNSMVGKIDALYQSSISSLNPRVIVRGEQAILTSADAAARIRTLLLAGIRAAVLWHQLGGSRWKLIFSRSKYVATAKRMLRQL